MRMPKFLTKTGMLSQPTLKAFTQALSHIYAVRIKGLIDLNGIYITGIR